MIVVDIESSGLDPVKNSILSIGAIDFAHPENQFYGECFAWDGAHIEKDALAWNGFTLEQATDKSKMSEKELVQKFIAWAMECEECTFAGHNTSFDRDFLKAASARNHIDWPFAQRTLDLHTIAYVDMIQKGIEIPLKKKHSNLSLDKILVYLGIPEEPKPHNGLNGAKLEAECYARFLHKRNLLPEFSIYPVKNS